MKLSFRKRPRETGLRGVGYPNPITDVKIDGKIVGHLYPPTWNSKHRGWIINLAIIKKDIMEDGNPNCTWKWVRVSKNEFDTEPLAREYLIENKDEIFGKLNLYYFED